jgi:hypothetical protein
VGLTVLVTLLFGVFGVIPASIHSSRAARIGAPTGRYWKAFGWTMAAGLAVLVAFYAVIFLGLLGLVRSAESSQAALSGGSVLNGSAISGDDGTETGAGTGTAVATDPGESDNTAPTPEDEAPYPTIVLPSIARICPESRGTGRYVTFDAYSPVTHKWYTVDCTGDAPVTCTGANDVNVLILIYASDAQTSRDG